MLMNFVFVYVRKYTKINKTFSTCAKLKGWEPLISKEEKIIIFQWPTVQTRGHADGRTTTL